MSQNVKVGDQIYVLGRGRKTEGMLEAIIEATDIHPTLFKVRFDHENTLSGIDMGVYRRDRVWWPGKIEMEDLTSPW